MGNNELNTLSSAPVTDYELLHEAIVNKTYTKAAIIRRVNTFERGGLITTAERDALLDIIEQVYEQ